MNSVVKVGENMLVKRMLAGMLALLMLSFSAAASEGRMRLCINTGEVCALLDETGEEIISPGDYDALFCVVPDQLFAMGKTVGGEILYQLTDSEGVVLNEIACEMFDASHDVILFRRNGLYGAMNLSGEVLLPAMYTQLVTNEAGGYLAFATDPNDEEADEIIFIDAAGEMLPTGVLSSCGLTAFESDRMPFCSPDTERYGYVDSAGKIAVDADLSTAGDFSDGIARASKDGLFGVLSPSGKWLIPPKYSFLEIGKSLILTMLGNNVCIVWDSASCSELFRLEGMAMEVSLAGDMLAVADGQRVSLYDREGFVILKADAGAVLMAGAGEQLILSDGDWGTSCVSVVDAQGKRMPRSDQQLLTLDDERYAYMTMDVAAYNSAALGEIRYSCNYDSIRYGMIDTDGREILPAEYLEIRCIGDSRYLTISDDGLRVIDGEGNVLWSLIEEEESAEEEQPVP